MPSSTRDNTVNQVVERLSHRFPEASNSQISAIVTEEYDLISENPIRIYVPNLVEHDAKDRLRQLRPAV